MENNFNFVTTLFFLLTYEILDNFIIYSIIFFLIYLSFFLIFIL
jgi:hypothetical protein